MEEIARWAAPIAITIAALMTASNLGSRITGWGFGVFLVGSLLWTYIGIASGEMGVIVQNVVLTLLNIFGMWRWLGRQASIEDGGAAAHAKSRRSDSDTLFPVSLLTRAPVNGAGGKALGKAVDAMAACSDGRIAYLVVSEGGVGGVGETLRRVDWETVVPGKDDVRLEATSLEGCRTLEADNWPGR